MKIEQVIQNFKVDNFNKASVDFFKYLNIPINKLIEDSIDINSLLGENIAFDIVDTTYMIGGIDDNIFKGKETEIELKAQRYESLLIFAIELNISNPTRTQLSKISRVFNRKFEYTPVVILFRYGNKISISNTQREKYSENQKWRDGEKVGKVSILRDIDIDNPHRGHIDILEKMKISTDINSYEKLYSYWQEVFDVSILNKLFYKELSNWYFWTLKENNVSFPNAPKDISISRHEHNAKNVIRLLTRLLFVWFMKEKKLIPNELFEEKFIKENLLKEFEPKKADGLFSNSDTQSKYYKGVLQNLFFATLNQEMGKRAFRNNKQHRNITNLMRYENYFKDSKAFIELVEKVVPFMNGGLFECLDKPHPTEKGRQGGEVIIYEDGFSDRPDNELVVPDYIFFGYDSVDLSSEYGTKGKANKDTKIKGLINILESYKFTVAENTPIEEDVALDPELLGKVFENLLASYNPETKTTARKQTGSFYTPREIVSYMVDESLITYLKTQLDNYKNKDELDKKLHQLLAYDEMQPFEDNETILKIINAIDRVKILDPAVGSGAFPMGTLQKMVHLLYKLDPNNNYWKDLQLEKANKETNKVFKTEDRKEREEKLIEINNAFDESVNHPDYARKLYIIENSIFGVDIQPIAIQISKLRFFISLVVEQNVNNKKPNFGIRPLPNLESKFVTANTLIGIEKVENNLFDHTEINELEKELKEVRHKIFNAKTPKTKNRLREQDKELREEISKKLIENGLGNDTAKQLASWNPYDQNASSPFFDMEWMFGIDDGFDIVIGNPPYLRVQGIDKQSSEQYKKIFESATGSYDLYVLFTEKALDLLSKNGILNYIMPHKWINSGFGKGLRTLAKDKISKFISFGAYQVFNASTYTSLVWLQNNKTNKHLDYVELDRDLTTNQELEKYLTTLNDDNYTKIDNKYLTSDNWIFTNKETHKILEKLKEQPLRVSNIFDKIFTGLQTNKDSVYFLKNCKSKDNLIIGYSDELEKEIEIEKGLVKPLLKGNDVHRYEKLQSDKVVIFPYYIKDDKAILYTEDEIKEKFPYGYKYLKECEAILRGRERGRLENDDFWFKYIYPKNLVRFNYEKLIQPDISLGANFAYDKKGEFYQTTTLYGYRKYDEVKESYTFYMAILNSKLLWWYLTQTGTTLANGYFRFKPNYLNPFPIPKIDDIEDTKPFEILVDYIMYLKTLDTPINEYVPNSHIIKSFEEVLDAMVYELYFKEEFENKLIRFEKESGYIKFIEYAKEDYASIENIEDDNKKIEIIHQSYQTLREPYNKIRNNLILIDIHFKELIVPIKESL